MFLFIYLIAQEIFIHCAIDIGCINISASHFNHLLAMGALELVMETPMTVKIYKLSMKFAKEEEEKRKASK